MRKELPFTAAQEILLAAADLAASGKHKFTEWDLTVFAWQRNRNRFGCRGYEDEYPDHKRVMMEIMGKTKKDNPIRRGWMEKAGTNQYRVTALGLAEAERINHMKGNTTATVRSPQLIYEAIELYVFHRVFLDYCRDPEEPRTWLGASAFLKLSQNSAIALEDRIRQAENAVSQAIGWFDDEKQDLLRSGPVGGKRTIRRSDVENL